MKIAFDVDGVVLQSIDIILDHINRSTDRNIAPDDLAAWDLEPLGIDLPVLRDAVEYLYEQPHVRPYEGAVEALSAIYRACGEPLLFITGRSDPSTARRQLEALPWNPTVPDMVVTGGDRDKRLYLETTSARFIIEDDVKFAQDYLDAGIGVGLMVRPWNRHTKIPVSRRFSGWTEVQEWFLKHRS
jgi:hypothetical protein